jgi:thiopurine S-methyltransferase
MDISDWQKRWQEGKTGFHEAEVNRYLAAHEATLTGGEPTRVLVPLCGKSRDMAFLAGKGHHVVGVEGSPLAVASFFEEEGLTPARAADGPFERVEGAGVTLLQGDFLAATSAQVGEVTCAYDRAALIAVSTEERQRYAETLLALLPVGGRVLLISFIYDQSSMAGPPFSLPHDDVRALFGARCRMELLDDRDAMEEESRFRDRGLAWVREAAWMLTIER